MRCDRSRQPNGVVRVRKRYSAADITMGYYSHDSLWGNIIQKESESSRVCLTSLCYKSPCEATLYSLLTRFLYSLNWISGVESLGRVFKIIYYLMVLYASFLQVKYFLIVDSSFLFRGFFCYTSVDSSYPLWTPLHPFRLFATNVELSVLLWTLLSPFELF